MAWETAASFVELYMRRARPRKFSKVSNAFSRAEVPLLKESRTQPMVPLASTTVSKQRSERRIAVRLPLKVSGRDSRGFAFEEDTSSENLCRNGAAFVTRFDVAIGSDLEIRIPLSQYGSRRAGLAALSRRPHLAFSTPGRVLPVCQSRSGRENHR